MKKFFTYTLCALMAAVSCDVAQIGKKEDYNPAKVPDTPQVYFSKDTQSSEIALTQDATEFSIGLARVDSAEPLDVEIVAEGETENFLIPSVVKFAAGEKAADLKIQISTPLSPNEFKTITLKLADASLGSEYGATSITFKVGVNLPWNKFGAGGTFYESPDWWGETEEKQIEYQVISENIWFCKIPQCFGKETIAGGEPYECQDYLFYWNKATDILYPVSSWMGYESGGKKMFYGTEADWILFANNIDPGTPGTADWFKWMDAARTAGSLKYIPYYDGNGIFYICDCYFFDLAENPQGSGVWDKTPDRFVDNGFTHTDYTIEVAYDGMYVNPDGQASALLNITAKGADAKIAKYMITSQDVAPLTTLTAIMLGEDPAISTALLTKDVPSVQQLDIEPGLYRAVVVPGDDNTLSAEDAVAVDFYFPGVSGEKKEVEVDLVLTKPGDVFPQQVLEANKMTDYNSFAYVITGKELKTISYYANTSAAIATWKNPLEDLVATYGSPMPDSVIAGINENGGYANGFLNRSPATEYEMIIVATNVYGSTKTLDVKYTTAAMPYSGELVIGNYSVTTMSGYPSVITVYPTETENHFLVENLLIENLAKWHADYNPTAHTLTLDGTESGYEQYGNQFGAFYGYLNQAKTQYYQLESYASELSDGSDPIVFDVDPVTHQLIKVHPNCYCNVYLDADDSLIGPYEVYADGAAVAYIPANTAVAKRTASAATLSKTISTNVKHQAKAGRKSVVNRFETSANKVLSNNYAVKPGLFTRTIDGWSKRIEISRKGKTFSAHTAQFTQVM